VSGAVTARVAMPSQPRRGDDQPSKVVAGLVCG
jgi:hypothetical protein